MYDVLTSYQFFNPLNNKDVYIRAKRQVPATKDIYIRPLLTIVFRLLGIFIRGCLKGSEKE